MDVHHLVFGLGVEVDKLLAGWSVRRLVVVGGKGVENALGTCGDAVGLVSGLGLVGGFVLGVEVVESLKELVRDAVFLVEVEGTLGSGVADDVALGEVLGDDSGSWLLLLGDLIGVAVAVHRWVKLLGALSSGDGDLGLAELGVVKEEGSLGCCLLLEDDGSALSLAAWGDLDLGDLSAEAEEPKGKSLADVVSSNGAVVTYSLISFSEVEVEMFLT